MLISSGALLAIVLATSQSLGMTMSMDADVDDPLPASKQGVSDLQRRAYDEHYWNIWPSSNSFDDILKDFHKRDSSDYDHNGDAARLMISRVEQVKLNDIFQVPTAPEGRITGCELDSGTSVITIKYYNPIGESMTKSFPFSRQDLVNQKPGPDGVKRMHDFDFPLWPRLLKHAMKQFDVPDAERLFAALPRLEDSDGRDFPCGTDGVTPTLCNLAGTVSRFTGRGMIASKPLTPTMDSKDISDLNNIVKNADKLPVFLWTNQLNYMYDRVHVIMDAKSIHELHAATFQPNMLPALGEKLDFKDLVYEQGQGTAYLVYFA